MMTYSTKETSTSTDSAVEEMSSNEERILCNHCQRTAKNGIRCMGMCVADSDY